MNCRCSHPRNRHYLKSGQCMASVDSFGDPFASGEHWESCKCEAYDNSALPFAGERLEFGKHRIPADEAETAPAWAPGERS